MNTGWHLFEEKKPPEEVILLVNGPLGLDLAVQLEEWLFFKKGDDWSEANLEHWSFNTPTQWAECSLPSRDGCGFEELTFDNNGNPSNRER